MEYRFGKYKIEYTDKEELEEMLDIVIDEYLGIVGVEEEELVDALRSGGFEVEKVEGEE